MRRADPPRPEELDPIERASRDELMALQLERSVGNLRRVIDKRAP